MGIFEVTGGKKLSGVITPQGAKNEALQIISAVLLTKEEVTISNIPDIIDVSLLISLLQQMNVTVSSQGQGVYSFKADNVNIEFFKSKDYQDQSGKLRGSVLL